MQFVVSIVLVCVCVRAPDEVVKFRVQVGGCCCSKILKREVCLVDVSSDRVQRYHQYKYTRQYVHQIGKTRP